VRLELEREHQAACVKKQRPLLTRCHNLWDAKVRHRKAATQSQNNRNWDTVCRVLLMNYQEGTPRSFRLDLPKHESANDKTVQHQHNITFASHLRVCCKDHPIRSGAE